MKIKTPLFATILLSLFLLIKLDNLTPLSSCKKGRISPYNNWSNGGTCGFGAHQNAVGPSYLYPVAPNEELFGNNIQCGVCYEMVGTYGAIKVRVEDYCPKNSESGYCSGDMFHFNIANNSSPYILGNETLSNISFRMVSCDYSGNIKILTDPKSMNDYLLFVISEHNLAVSSVEIKESNSQKWTKQTRNQNTNKWLYYNSKSGIITYPVVVRIYSINGDYVDATLPSGEPNRTYEANGNFNVPQNTYFDISTLQKINNVPNNDDSNKCCELDKSDYTPIYKDGILKEIYIDNSQNVEVIKSSTDKYLDNYSLKAKFQNNGNLIFKSKFPIRADQFLDISFSMKSSILCSNCLYFRAYNLNNNNKVINFDKTNTWSNYTFSFENLGIQNNEFNGIIFSYNNILSNDNLEINIENIQLIPNLNAGICFSSQNYEVPSHENTPLTNNTDLIYINSINIYENTPNILNINCQRFINNENKKIVLKFKSANNNNFDVDNCDAPSNSVISSFKCTLPNNIPDGIYDINSQSTNNAYNIQYPKEIEIKKGLVICDSEFINSVMSSYSNVYYSPLIIIHSKEQIINKGDKVTFDIYPIPQEKYNLDNDEIILFNNNGKFPLYLKNCGPNIINNKEIFSIKCLVSNNIMASNYTSLYNGQIANVLDGQRINLISLNSNGGIITNNYMHTVESDLTKEEKSKYNLIFNVLYYNPNVLPGSEFPHKIYLYGKKKNSNSNLRKLEDNYNSQIILSNCTAGDYSSEYSNAIAFVNCKMPDFVPAGTYTKLECDGLDLNPQNTINLELKSDFNKSSNSYTYPKNKNSSEYYDDDDDDEKSSSSSGIKEWIIWVIVVVLVIILVVLVIIIMACKKTDGEDSSEQKSNDSKAPANNTTSD